MLRLVGTEPPAHVGNLLEEGTEWMESRCCLVDVARARRADETAIAHDHPHASAACPRGEFACQAGLPDAALATEEDEGAYSVAEFSQEAVERSKPVRTPDQAGAVDVSTSTEPELAVPRLTAQFAEHGRDIAGIADAVGRPLREQPQEERVELRGYRDASLRQRDRHVLQVTLQDVHRRAAGERRLTGQALVEHATKRIQIRPRVPGLAAYLLGCHVRARPDERAADVKPVAAFHRAQLCGEAEVHQHGCPVRSNDDVRRRQVAEHEALPMEEGQGRAQPAIERERPRQVRRFADPRRTLRAPDVVVVFAERPARKQLHRVPRHPLAQPFVDDFHDAGVIDAPERQDLAAKARNGALGRKTHGLQRYAPSRLRMLGSVHDPHATSAEHPTNPIRADALRRRNVVDRAAA